MYCKNSLALNIVDLGVLLQKVGIFDIEDDANRLFLPYSI